MDYLQWERGLAWQGAKPVGNAAQTWLSPLYSREKRRQSLDSAAGLIIQRLISQVHRLSQIPTKVCLCRFTPACMQKSLE